ncbi:ELMO domain-containing protein A [Zostera marina]|uniref:ELMO domain-containing protein A n=1 Tax=Zostera marina TaxID=29655 RepID=A0A0K9PEY2_ZOSMR|nr:ELMO domain-containing protein A [Zostera marina]
MASQTLRRRVRHNDNDGGLDDYEDNHFSDSINVPLLGKYAKDNNYTIEYDDRSQDIWDDKKKENLHWSFLFSQLISQWAQWLGSFIVGSGSFIGRFLALPLKFQTGQIQKRSSIFLNPIQEERLSILKQRLKVSYDGEVVNHQNALIELWELAYPNRETPPLKSELWKEMGWQGCDPSTDFRGAGFISLENLIFFAKNHFESFQRLLLKKEGQRSEWEYPFAVAGINLSFMLAQMLDLQSGIPTSSVGIKFLKLLGADRMAFDNLYCVAFKLMDAQWLAKRASYMEFNDVLKSTRTQLERELALEDVFCVKDLPSYTILEHTK